MPDSAGPQKAPPYPWIAKQLKEGKVVPFLGASASMYHSDSLSPPALCPPSATALARELANLAQFPDPPPADEELARVASYFALESIGRDGLDQALRDKFSPRFEPNGLHAFLARVAKKSPMIIITTNYDDMIEQAFKDEKTPYQLIVTMLKHEDGSAEVRYRPKEGGLRKVDPNEDLSLKDVPIIYKMHGSIRPQPEEDSYLITEEDYVCFMVTMMQNQSSVLPPTFLNAFRYRTFLFLGYSLEDWNFRVLLHARSPLRL